MNMDIKNKLGQRIQNHFEDSIATKQKSAEVLPSKIIDAINLMYSALMSGKKILACGNGGSAADAQHFAEIGRAHV